MPLLGYQGTGANARPINGSDRGIIVTMPENGTLNSVTAKLDDASSGQNYRAGIWTSPGDVLIASSTIRTNITTLGDYTFTGFGTVNLVNGTSYRISIASDSGADANAYFDTGGGFTGRDGTLSTIDPLSANSFADTTRNYRLFLDYTAGGGGGLSAGVRKILLDLFG